MPTLSPLDWRSWAADSAADLLPADLRTMVQAERPAGQSGNVLVAVGVGVGVEPDGVALGVVPGAIAPPPAGAVAVGVTVAPTGGWSPSFSGAPVVGNGVGAAPTAALGVGVAVGASATRAG